ncbi:hypothetical protein NEUTE1DRAFT_116529 [Neurospora tetrasperma FGSC 2508]|uniref:Uncharacterized protein n=1 Tax=Neurospora tetrasperma (strain FGSC 2508 / ATCC MYA-4615 / P0657) TaxID=510951 RepID=F8MGQ5_NEUT8|nr:uncharacterized protein NEUTE1DRAFT_116529 [Neurospora tetrasperma FGSC 2508]EGO59474.1 hypothetical protein NEUTE1DRAFT_116529 [Neurospora tetrasperma FGSC 2508]EGZ73599.1 hypothetical protein NEUTE2DRAFT_144224 [Neurospora tetrasperma FGSC 2509]
MPLGAYATQRKDIQSDAGLFVSFPWHATYSKYYTILCTLDEIYPEQSQTSRGQIRIANTNNKRY